MTKEQVKKVAIGRGVAVGTLRKDELIRLIQKTEGNEQCFGTGAASTCGQTNCLWREDCK
jgi:hypothetical protein